MSAVRPAIYVATLNDYNNGILHGAWIDASLPSHEIEREIERLLAASPTARRTGEPAEEWVIHDHEGFASPIDAHDNIADIAAATQLALELIQAEQMTGSASFTEPLLDCPLRWDDN